MRAFLPPQLPVWALIKSWRLYDGLGLVAEDQSKASRNGIRVCAKVGLSTHGHLFESTRSTRGRLGAEER